MFVYHWWGMPAKKARNSVSSPSASPRRSTSRSRRRSRVRRDASGVRLRQTPVRHFVDPSLAVAALHATPARLTADLEFLRLLFESLVVRDMRVHAQAADALRP